MLDVKKAERERERESSDGGGSGNGGGRVSQRVTNNERKGRKD